MKSAEPKSQQHIWSLSERDAQNAMQKLQTTVRSLTRAKRLQTLVESIWTGLFCGLASACVMVLMIRFNLIQLPYTLPLILAGIIGSALIVAVIMAWQRSPDDLQVAILADIQLNLKQKLSTAWEFAQAQSSTDHSALADQLAFQAAQARIPARAEHVFPLGINTWGKLTPILIALLLLLIIVDLQTGETGPVAPVVDPIVVEQGIQLREYARQMQRRAQREDLPRSAEESQNMQRLGNRMESGNLSREQALNRLRELATSLEQQRQSALTANTTAETKIDPEKLDPVSVRSPVAGSNNLRTTLEDLAQGRLQSSEVRFSDNDENALSRHGISREDLERALERLDAGDDQDLREILEQLKSDEQRNQAQRDAEELDKAQQKLNQVRENLGDSEISSSGEGGPGEEALPGEDEGGYGEFGERPDKLFSEQNGDPSSGRGSGYGQQTGKQQPSSLRPQTDSEGQVSKPQSQLREGEVFTSEVRVLPRSGQPTLDIQQLDHQYSAQVEAALSKEDYPLHHKELIRRYFLTLSADEEKQ